MQFYLRSAFLFYKKAQKHPTDISQYIFYYLLQLTAVFIHRNLKNTLKEFSSLSI